MSAGPRSIGNYRVYERIGAGGMGNVHLGQLFASGGFRRIVAIKRLHPHLAEDADFVTAFLDEARVASRIHHPNVVAPLDVVAKDGEVFIVLEHVLGLPLTLLLRRAEEMRVPLPPRIAASIMVNVLHGLHAAHEATGDDGEPLHLVHRDVSPHNILVGKDGVARLLDFGVAKATGRAQSTAEGIIKGKRGYMAPEHLLGQSTRASDIYSASVVLWEALAERRLFADDESVSRRVHGTRVDRPDETPFGAIALRGLAHRPDERFATAREMAIALEEEGIATPREVGEWVECVAEADIAERARLVATAESAIAESGGAGGAPAAEVYPPGDGATEQAIARVVLEGAVTETSEMTPPPRRRRTILAGAVVVALVGVIALVSFTRHGGIGAVVHPEASADAPASTVSTASPTPAPAPTPPQSTAASSAPTEVSPPRSSSDRLKPASAPGARRPAGAVKAPCKPYVIDKDGRKQFNEACLR